jgi:hypothetical protein
MSTNDQTFYYLENLCEYLIFWKRDVEFRDAIKHYRLDKSSKEFSFFAKCPEEILDIHVYQIYGGELHQVDTLSFTPRRFFYTKTTLSNEELEASLFGHSFIKKGDLYVHKYMIAFKHQDGVIFASKNCKKYLGD